MFNIGDTVEIVKTFMYSKFGLEKSKGKILDVNHKKRYLVETSNNLKSHKLYGKGQHGYCYMIDERFIKGIK